MVGRRIAVEGAAERFRSLFDRHYPDVARYALRRVGRDDADDVADEVFCVAWRRIDAAPPEPETLWWLYGIARRVVSNHLRGSRRRARLQARFAPAVETAEPGLADGALLHALDGLKATDREILQLIAWEDLQPRELAGVLGCSPATAAVRAHRAKARLRVALEREGWDRDDA